MVVVVVVASVKPMVLFSLYFNVDNSSRRDLTSAVENILVVAGPDECIDYDHAVAEVCSLATSSYNAVSKLPSIATLCIILQCIRMAR